MKYRIFAIMLAVVMLLTALPVSAEEVTEPAAAERAPGYCGEAILWEYADGLLTITGAGEMDDFPEGAPWEVHKEEIEKVIISGGITYVGANAFRDYDQLKEVEFGSAVYEIGEYAFFSCDGLTVIRLPASFKVFGPSSFMGCTNLKEFHCEGKFPSFKQNCLWDTYAKIYFPADRPWGVEYIRQLEEAFKGRIEFLASDGTDPYVPTEPAEETQIPTEAPTEAPTEIPTEAPTTVPPVTQAPEEEAAPPILIMPAPTQPQETEGGVTEPLVIMPAPQEKERSKTGFIIIGCVGAFLLLGTLVFGGKKKGRYSR